MHVVDAPLRLDSPLRADAYTPLARGRGGEPVLKIGDFARIGQVSIKALRHYDALGLLRPTHIHPRQLTASMT